MDEHSPNSGHQRETNVVVLAVSHVLLSVQEPLGNLEVLGLLDDVDDALELVRVQLTGTDEL